MKICKFIWCILFLFSILIVGCTTKPLDLLSLVSDYAENVNTNDLEAIMAMHTEDAQIIWPEGNTFDNLEEIRASIEYFIALNQRVDFQNCAANGTTVTCEATIRNDLLMTAGVDDLFSPSYIFTFTEEGGVQKITYSWSAESAEVMNNVFSEFLPWLNAERPEEFAQLFGTDGFICSESNGHLIMDMMNLWQAEK